MLIEREFAQEGDLEQALELIQDSQGIQQSRELAAHHTKLAIEHLATLPPSESHQALIKIAEYAISRLY